MVLILYHVTTRENAEKIIDKGASINIPQVLISRGKPMKKAGTLGYGFYTFSDYALAEKFAEERIQSDDFVSLKVSTKDEDQINILDLSVEENLKVFNHFKYQLYRTPLFKLLSQDHKNNGPQSSLEGVLIDTLLRDKRFLKLFDVQSIDIVKGMTVTQLIISRKSNLANGFEYCIKNKESIVEVGYYETQS